MVTLMFLKIFITATLSRLSLIQLKLIDCFNKLLASFSWTADTGCHLGLKPYDTSSDTSRPELKR